MFSKDIGIDLGTSNVLIYVKGEGIVLNEPSVVALNEDDNTIIALGAEAKDMLGRTPGKVKAIRPLKDGVIADFEITEIMLNHFLKKVLGKNIFLRPKIVICCPTNITSVEKNAIKETAEKVGAKKVYIEEEPKAAALGAGLDISLPSGSMIVDIGGGTTDIAVLSLGGIVSSASIKIAGNTLDKDIIKYIKDKYKLLIGERTAEEIKIKIGTLFEEKCTKVSIKGRNLVTGLPHSIQITSLEIKEALMDSIYQIIRNIKTVLEQTPPELSADIIEKGIILSGGGAMLNGLDKLIEKELKVPVKIAENPLSCVAEGTGILLNNLYLIER